MPYRGGGKGYGGGKGGGGVDGDLAPTPVGMPRGAVVPFPFAQVRRCKLTLA